MREFQVPAIRLAMRNIREILRLRVEHGLSHREIGQAVNKSPATVGAIVVLVSSANRSALWRRVAEER